MGDDAELKLLPPRTRELAKRIGLPALRKLSRKWGGVSIYVPSKTKLRRGHPLARLIGWEAAEALADEEGRRIDIPFANQAMNAVLHAQVREYRRTHSVRETALHFRISERWVWQLTAGDDAGPTPQADLFEAKR